MFFPAYDDDVSGVFLDSLPAGLYVICSNLVTSQGA
jgi:hypothetical protein